MHSVLFVCIHNSARSQMAEAFLNHLGGGNLTAESAGIEAGKLNPNVVEAMNELGIDIGGNDTKQVSAFISAGRTYDVVITVCDAASAERCPVVPGAVRKIAWFFDDPSTFKGSKEEVMQQVRAVRDEIKEKVQAFVEEASKAGYWL